MTNGSTILGLAAVLGLVGCIGSEEPSTLGCTAQQNLAATSGEGDVPICESDDVHVDTSTAETRGAATFALQASDAGDAPRTKMPNIKHPDLTR